MNKIISRAVLIIEILLAFFFSAIIIDTAITYSNSTEAISTEKIINLIALLSAIVFPLAAHIMIRIKHRSNTPEGEILPFLFLSTTLECISFLPTYYIDTGVLLLDPILINVLIRFSFLSNALIFLYVALLLMGVNNNNYLSYFVISMLLALILSIIAPNSSAIQAAGSNFGSDYDVYFNYAIALITLASLVTFIGAATKDKMRHSIERCITYVLMVVGNYGIFTRSHMGVTAAATVILIIGCIMLMMTSKESF